MNKETVIANVRAELSLSGGLRHALTSISEHEEAWFAREHGDDFLQEFGRVWNQQFVEVVQTELDNTFGALGLSDDLRPQARLTDYRRGSWIMELAVVVYASVGTVYTVFKGLSELPKIADGLEELKTRLNQELSSRYQEEVRERIEPYIGDLPFKDEFDSSTLEHAVDVNCTIDARPLRSISPAAAKSHSIHISVAVSQSALSVENLGDEDISDLRIGIFVSDVQKHSWSFAEACRRTIPKLSAGQSIVLALQDFESESGEALLEMSDDQGYFVDCWLQDNSGIYLFNFYLEES